MIRVIRVLCALALVSLSLLTCSDDQGTRPKTTPVPDLTAYDLVTVPATFGYPMGWPGWMTPVHTVSLASFQIGKHEIAYRLWAEVRDWALARGYVFAHPGQQGSGASNSTPQHPATMISWRDCIAWCNAASEREGLTPVYYNSGAAHTSPHVYRNASTGGNIGNQDAEWGANGFRLLTEAEWEYAARYIDGAGLAPGDQHCGYDLFPAIEDCAWYSANAADSTHPVGEKQPNSLGLRDMSGNVWEWCWDWYAGYSSDTQDNPHGPSAGIDRVLRSGSYRYGAIYARSSYRSHESPDGEFPDDGFRVCRSAL
jgi:formylglycine-generating enzyme required for sulfatase activity